MNVLLHICCAPCAIYPIEKLRKDGHKIAGFFYNPNIHPYSEYLKRRGEVEKYSKEAALNVTYSGYDVEDYFQHVVYNEAQRDRCPVCWWIRLRKAARHARENNLEAFSTTLLGSPYQDHETVKRLCEDVALQSGIKFYYNDFRTGFKDAHNVAKSKGIYCQNYCGCIFSEKERIEKKSKIKMQKSKQMR